MENKYTQVISELYAKVNSFAKEVESIFEKNEWTWYFNGEESSRIPKYENICFTVESLIYDVEKSIERKIGDYHYCATGRIEVVVYTTSYGTVHGEIKLVPVYCIV